MADLLLDDTDELNLECRSGCGSQSFFRMKSNDFEIIVNLIELKIKKQNTSFSRAISSDWIFLSFVIYLFMFANQNIAKIIPDECDVIHL